MDARASHPRLRSPGSPLRSASPFSARPGSARTRAGSPPSGPRSPTRARCPTRSRTPPPRLRLARRARARPARVPRARVAARRQGLVLAQAARRRDRARRARISICERAKARDGVGAAVLARLSSPRRRRVPRRAGASSSRSRSSRCSCCCSAKRRAAGPRAGSGSPCPLLALWANLHGGVLVGFAVARRVPRAPSEPAGSRRLAGVLVLRRRRPRSSRRRLCSTPSTTTPACSAAPPAAEHYGLWAPLSFHEPAGRALHRARATAARRGTAEAARGVGARRSSSRSESLTVDAHRNGLWLVLFAADAGGPRASGSRAAEAAGCSARLALVCAVRSGRDARRGLRTARPDDGAERAGCSGRAAALAHRTPDPRRAGRRRAARASRRPDLDRQPARRVRAARPASLSRLAPGPPAGDAILRGPAGVVLVERGSAAQRRLADCAGASASSRATRTRCSTRAAS